MGYGGTSAITEEGVIDLSISAGGNQGRWTHTDFVEFDFYKTALSAAQITSIQTYMQNKYNL